MSATTASRLDAVSHLLSDARGVYIPRDFCEGFNITMWGLDPESWEVQTCKAGPDKEGYWDAWQEVLNDAVYKYGDDTYMLHQDGDLWALCLDRMTDEEKSNFGFDE